MFFRFKPIFSSFFITLSTSLSLLFLSVNALADPTTKAETHNEEENEKALISQKQQYPTINMDEAKFSEGYEDMKGFLNAVNFDPLKIKAYGSPDAPLTLYNFSSYSCSHCGNFHQNSLSKIHQKYIATGKLRIVFSNIAFDQLGLFLTNGSFATKDLKQYMSYSSAIYENQSKVFSKDAEQEIKKILTAESMTFEDLYEVANRTEVQNTMIKFLDYTSKILKVNGTPTFILTHTGHSPEQPLGRVEGNDEKAVMNMIEKQLNNLQ